MSNYESGEQIGLVQKSSVKITRTAKGDVVPEVKVYEETTDVEMERIRTLAVAAYRDTLRDLESAAA